MNEQKLINNLKELRAIEPDAEYSSYSRFLILSIEKKFQEKQKLSPYGLVFNNFYLYRIAPSLGIIITIITIGYLAFSYLPTQQKKLVAEANEVNAEIQIKLDDIQYYLNNNQTISQADAIIAIELLQQSAKELNEAKDINSNNENIEEALIKIKNAQETLTKINDLLK